MISVTQQQCLRHVRKFVRSAMSKTYKHFIAPLPPATDKTESRHRYGRAGAFARRYEPERRARRGPHDLRTTHVRVYPRLSRYFIEVLTNWIRLVNTSPSSSSSSEQQRPLSRVCVARVYTRGACRCACVNGGPRARRVCVRALDVQYACTRTFLRWISHCDGNILT